MALVAKVSPDAQQLLALYDRELRKHRHARPHQSVDELAEVTRVITRYPDLHFGSIIFSNLELRNADEVIGREIQFFQEQGLPFEWRVHRHDVPPNLGDRLVALGLGPRDPEAILVRDLQAEGQPAAVPDGIRWQRISVPDELEALLSLDLAARGEENPLLGFELVESLRYVPDKISIHLAWAGAVPVARGWTIYHPESGLAELWGAETLREYRHRGIYRSLVSRRIEEARARGMRYLFSYALSSSQPILERMGFTCLTAATPYLWIPL